MPLLAIISIATPSSLFVLLNEQMVHALYLLLLSYLYSLNVVFCHKESDFFLRGVSGVEDTTDLSAAEN